MAYYKMAVYGAPAVGKSVFSLGWPDPFFICTDGNYDFLYEFGAKEENHIQVHDWKEFKDFIDNFDFNKHETIVIDLIEDLYQWCVWDFCKKNRIDDLGDLGAFGKGYNMVANTFIPYIDTIINRSKNLIILSHEDVITGKTNRGVEYVDYKPSSLLRLKIWERIAGKLRFCFRAHLEEEVDEKGKYEKKRLLSVSPKPHEYQINRGTNVDSLPDDIELTYQAFTSLFGTPSSKGTIKDNQVTKSNKVETINKKEILNKKDSANTTEIIKESKSEVSSQKEEKAEEKKVEEKAEEKKDTKISTPTAAQKKNEEGVSTLDKINAIRAKLGLPPKTE